MEEEEFDPLVTEVYQGVPIFSRHNKMSEITEMRAFVDDLVAEGLLSYVSKLEYDSKAELCFICPAEHPEERIARIGERHISQFEWQGVVRHKKS